MPTIFLFITSMVMAATHPPATRITGWQQYASVADAGFDSVRLDVARRYADSVMSGAVMVVHRGYAVAAWGDVSRPLELHSVRKSVVSALYGVAHDRRSINLDQTLGSLGVRDISPLSEMEQRARLRDLLAARSGVYLPAAYADASQDRERPARGSHAPDTHWFYNNWDFNVLGPLYEQLVDSPLYQSLHRRLAIPLGMEDFDPADNMLVYEPSNSVFPAHTIRMSARDLARFGQLYLQRGMWDGRRVLSESWVDESTSPKSETGPRQGYAYLWWTRDTGSVGDSYPNVRTRAMYYGSGTGGQLVLVIPSEELVIVHRGDTDHARNVSGRDVWRIVDMILGAKHGSAGRTPRLVGLRPVPFATQLPPRVESAYVTLDSAAMERVTGRYEVAPGVVARMFTFRGRLFGNFPGQGEAEFFAISPLSFTIRVMPGVRFDFEEQDGAIVGFTGQIGPQRVRGRKL